jgi:hypothetical protein
MILSSLILSNRRHEEQPPKSFFFFLFSPKSFRIRKQAKSHTYLANFEPRDALKLRDSLCGGGVAADGVNGVAAAVATVAPSPSILKSTGCF